MSTLIFQENEANVILKALNTRIESNRFDTTGINKTQEVIDNFKNNSLNEYNLKEKDRSWVLGCFKTSFIEPNIEYIKMSDYEVLFSDSNIISKIEELIEIIKIRNKLLSLKQMKDLKTEKYELFLARLDRISKFKNIQKILYTKTVWEKKIAILLRDGTGIKHSDFNMPIRNFKIEKIIESEYMVSTDPKNFVNNHFGSSNIAIDQVKLIVNKYYE